MSKVPVGETKNTLYCSFCGKSQSPASRVLSCGIRMMLTVLIHQ